MLIVVLVFLATWVVPNQIITVFLVQFLRADDDGLLVVLATIALCAFEQQSFVTAKCFAAVAAQLNSCLNFFIYAFRHSKFREHLRLMCGLKVNSLQTPIVTPNVKVDNSPANRNVIRY